MGWDEVRGKPVLLLRDVMGTPMSVRDVTGTPISVRDETGTPISVREVTGLPMSVREVTGTPISVREVELAPGPEMMAVAGGPNPGAVASRVNGGPSGTSRNSCARLRRWTTVSNVANNIRRIFVPPTVEGSHHLYWARIPIDSERPA